MDFSLRVTLLDRVALRVADLGRAIDIQLHCVLASRCGNRGLSKQPALSYERHPPAAPMMRSRLRR